MCEAAGLSQSYHCPKLANLTSLGIGVRALRDKAGRYKHFCALGTNTGQSDIAISEDACNLNSVSADFPEAIALLKLFGASEASSLSPPSDVDIEKKSLRTTITKRTRNPYRT